MRVVPGQLPMHGTWAPQTYGWGKMRAKPGKAPMRLRWANKRAITAKAQMRLRLDTSRVKPDNAQTPLWSMHKGPL
jgi:hypothetical protein